MFALSAIGFRGAILDLDLPELRDGGDLYARGRPRAAGGVAVGLSGAARAARCCFAIVGAWRPSLFAGFIGAVASQFWFLAFALATAASVRTLALVEVLFAQAISRFVFGQRTTAREALGMVLVVAGVALLIWAY